MTYVIEKGVPLPIWKGGRSKSEFRVAVEKMDIGDSVLNSTLRSPSVARLVDTVKNATWHQYTLRKTPEGVRVWRIA